jgi:hypothetical protein
MSDLELPEAEPAYLAPVYAEVDATMRRLAAKQFQVGPVVEGRYSRITSIVSSAYKRHGGIIERAFAAALRESPHLTVWEDPVFRVSAAVERLADSDATAMGNLLRYGGQDYVRTLQIDFLVFDDRSGRLGGYECKRGFGYHDSDKKVYVTRLATFTNAYKILRRTTSDGSPDGRSSDHLLLWSVFCGAALGADSSGSGQTFRRTGRRIG